MSVAAPSFALFARSQAQQALSEEEELIGRLATAKRHVKNQTDAPVLTAAPPEAFLRAQTSGLAIAQLEAYFSDLAQAGHVSVVSASAQPSEQADGPDIVRIQVSVDIEYEALQPLLYQLETGAPYVFVDTLRLRAANLSSDKASSSHHAQMKATLGLKAIWRSNAT
jgi:general secretion pathway protein M